MIVRVAAIAALVAAIFLGSWVARPEPASCTAPRETLQTVDYAADGRSADGRTELDIHASPQAHECPVLVWVHGGSWQAGDKATRLTTRKADHFIADGWVFVSINYRLAAEDNDVRWPAFGDDVAAAVRWVHDNIARYGGDPDRISLIGHSAGAHLVSIVGTNPSLLERQELELADLRCVISLDSVTHDLTDPPPWEVDIIELAFPTEAAKIDGSPTLQVEAGEGAPDYLIVTRGRQERRDSSNRLAAALIDAGAGATVADVSPYDHGEVSTELGVPGEQRVTPVVDGFLDDCE